MACAFLGGIASLIERGIEPALDSPLAPSTASPLFSPPPQLSPSTTTPRSAARSVGVSFPRGEQIIAQGRSVAERSRFDDDGDHPEGQMVMLDEIDAVLKRVGRQRDGELHSVRVSCLESG